MLDWPEREHYTAEDLIEILRIRKGKANQGQGQGRNGRVHPCASVGL